MLQRSFGLKIIGMGLATVLLAACETTSDETADTGMMDTSTQDQGVEAAPADEVVSEPMDMGPTPGTQEDLNETAGDRVFFGFDRYDLTPEAQATLRAQAEWLKSFPSVDVVVEGHCDERGTREYNLALGERRANSVRDYMMANGISSLRLESISYGEERPLAYGSGESNWAQNRRVELIAQ